MAKIFGVNTKISGKVGQLLYRQTKRGTIVSELPVKPAIPRRSARQMDLRTQWGNLAAIYKQFDSKLTAYAGKTFVVQPVVRSTVRFDIIPHLLFRPAYQRIDFQQPVLFIPLYHLHRAAGHRLGTA